MQGGECLRNENCTSDLVFTVRINLTVLTFSSSARKPAPIAPIASCSNCIILSVYTLELHFDDNHEYIGFIPDPFAVFATITVLQ